MFLESQESKHMESVYDGPKEDKVYRWALEEF